MNRSKLQRRSTTAIGLLLCFIGLGALGSASSPPSAWGGTELRRLGSLDEPALEALLHDLELSSGVRAVDDRAILVRGETPDGEVLIIQLEEPGSSFDLLYLYFLAETEAYLFLRISIDPARYPVVRLRGAGDRELVLSDSGFDLKKAPGGGGLALDLKADPPATSVVACISEMLGVRVDDRSIEGLLEDTSCGRLDLMLLATNCLAAPHPIATSGCVLGFAKALSCGNLRCRAAECSLPPGHNQYCRECGPCRAGQGDCDGDEECARGFSCVHNVGRSYGFSRSTDVCEDTGGCGINPGNENYCRDCGPCARGEGDCDGDDECFGGLECVDDVGSEYGFSKTTDVCEEVGL